MELLSKNLVDIMLEGLPFMAFGLFIAGLLKSYVPDNFIGKYLGNDNAFSPVKAAFVGMPIPLCSCSVIPVADRLRRGGAGRGALTSFLISAPETGVDSLSISYALLGPVMFVARIVSSLLTAIVTGWAAMGFSKGVPMNALPSQKSCCSEKGEECKGENQVKNSFFRRFIAGQRYAFTTLLDDSFKWIFFAFIVTAVLKTYVPQTFFSNYGDGLLAMIIMVIVGFPMYICASASTPIAAGLILTGVSPGAALVFLLSGPASNIATIAIVRKITNTRVAVIYVLGVVGVSIASGMTLNFLLEMFNMNVVQQVQSQTLLPNYLSIPSAIFVLLAAVKPLRPYMGLAVRSCHP